MNTSERLVRDRRAEFPIEAARPGGEATHRIPLAAAARQLGVAPSTIWRLLDRHDQTFKKNRARQRAGAGGRGERKAGMARRAA